MKHLRIFRKPMESYKGLHCGCAPGTHAALTELICRTVPIRPGVLDIGAHSGALLLRLREQGFSDLTGTDLDVTRFALPDCEFVRLELNEQFAKRFNRSFPLITCTDVIEHLDSPRSFLAEARLLLEAGGFLALSMPNVAHWEGRCKFVLKGELWGFGSRNYRAQRHISPLTVEMLTMLAQEVGFKVVEVGTGGSFATMLRAVVTFPLWGVMRLIGGRTAVGESLLVLLQRSEPSLELKTPTDYKDRWQGRPDGIGVSSDS